jgi:hypothetical protein
VCRIKLPANTEFLVKIASHFEQKKRKWKTIISTGLLMDKKKIEKHCPRTKVCDITGVQMKSSQVGYEFLMKEDRAK